MRFLGDVLTTFIEVGTYTSGLSGTIDAKRGFILIVVNQSRGGFASYFLNGDTVVTINEDSAIFFTAEYSDGKSKVKFTCTDPNTSRSNILKYRYI